MPDPMVRPRRVMLALLFAAITPAVSLSASAPSYAKNFDIVDHGTHRLITVRDAHRGAVGERLYALVPKGAPLPELAPGTIAVRTPVERVVVMEIVHVGFLEAIDRTSAIVGAATVDAIVHPGLRERIREGAVRRVQYGRDLDTETLLLLEPDLILTTVLGDPAFDLPPKLARSGLPVVLTAGYMEEHPLARAEWVKFVAAFFDEDERAEVFFTDITARYQELREKVSAADTRPTVFCGAPYSGVWHVPGGKSFTARAIHDAGGDYLWSDDHSRGGIPLDTERVFLRAADADVWLHPSHYRSLDALLAADPRFDRFRAARTGAVFNHTRDQGRAGGNAIWERGVVRPDQVLADLIWIFHPDVLPDHQPVYYERLR